MKRHGDVKDWGKTQSDEHANIKGKKHRDKTTNVLTKQDRSRRQPRRQKTGRIDRRDS